MKQKQKRVVVIGAGFAGLSAASLLARQGCDVVVLEKNDSPGGRARVLRAHGYVFDMGPSWYWMPEVFERYFAQFGQSPSDHYHLARLDPSFAVFFENRRLVVPASLEGIYALFDREEPGGAARLRDFLQEAGTKYNIAVSDFIYKPSTSVREFASLKFFGFLFRLSLFSSFHAHVRKYFSSEVLIRLLEFPVLFLGGSPRNIPGLYSMMNYAAFSLGTWYPMGGFSQVVSAMIRVGLSQGMRLNLSESVSRIVVERGNVTAVVTDKGSYPCDAVVNTADYVHAEQMIEKEFRNYDERYWNDRVMSPSCLIFYVGVKKELSGLEHHNLFFDAPFEAHARDIYQTPRWPDQPLFYVCCPSRTDKTVAPPGHENLFILMPLAAGLRDEEELRARFFNVMMDRIEERTREEVRPYIDFQKSYCINDFKNDYNSYKGNAYGLANTLNQTAFLKPSSRSKKIKNLFYAGQLTVPGPGVPPAIISGQIAASAVTRSLKQIYHEAAV